MPISGRKFFVKFLAMLVAWMFWLTAGCSSSTNVENVVARVNDSNIKRAANLFGANISRNDWRAPKDEAAFKDFIHNQMQPRKLEMMGVKPDSIDAIFVSERDGKPFKFRYGISIPAMSSAPVVFEQQGIDGIRQVASSNGQVELADKNRYEQLWGSAGTPSTSSSQPQEVPPATK